MRERFGSNRRTSAARGGDDWRFVVLENAHLRGAVHHRKSATTRQNILKRRQADSRSESKLICRFNKNSSVRKNYSPLASRSKRFSL